MARQRILVTVTAEEREAFEAAKGRDSLSATIVGLALKQLAFARKSASGAFRQQPANASAGRYGRQDEPSGTRYDRSDSHE